MAKSRNAGPEPEVEEMNPEPEVEEVGPGPIPVEWPPWWPDWNVQNVGIAPAVAMANLYVATSQALSIAAQNATSEQQQNNLIGRTATTRGVKFLLPKRRRRVLVDNVFLI